MGTIIGIIVRLFGLNLLISALCMFVTKEIWGTLIVTTIAFWSLYFLYRKYSFPYHRRRVQNIAKKYEGIKVETITEDGFTFRDLNKNGKLDVYEDTRLPHDVRMKDLLSKMSVEEKAGLLFNHFTFASDPNDLIAKQDEFYDTFPQEMIFCQKMNTLTIFGGTCDPITTAKVINELQRCAEKTRLAIPLTIASDPRHHYDAEVGAGAAQKGISRWPEQTGLAATRNTQLTQQCGKVVAKELKAQGIHILLGPMADTATSPMWGRNYGTFGDHYELVSELSSAFIKGAQEEGLLCQAKHFPGGGPQKDGWDSHFPYGKEQIYPNNKFQEHMEPFRRIIKEGVSQIMPYYSIPEGTEYEQVGFNFNKQIITDILRNELGFEGVIGTDFSIIEGTKFLWFDILFPKVWGVEKLTPIQRIKKAMDAGVDQFGGNTCVELLVKLVKNNEISMERLDVSCSRVLMDKFKLGLFDNPFVDEDKVNEVCGIQEHMDLGTQAQKEAYVLLKNGNKTTMLPLKKGIKIYCKELKSSYWEKYCEIVDEVEKADVAIIRKSAPQTIQNRYLYEKLFKQGTLDFDQKSKDEMIAIMNKVPTILDMGLDRPAILTDFIPHAQAITGHFGCEENVLADLLFGEFSPSGKLPFALPKSMEYVYQHKVDTPISNEDALYPFGYGLTY